MICAACKTDNAAESAFCEGCGKPLDGAAQATAAVDTTVTATPPREDVPSEEFLPGEGPSKRVGEATTVTPSGSAPLCVQCNGPVEDTYCTVCGAKQPDPRDHFEIVYSPSFAGVCDRGIQHSANQDSMSIAPGAGPDGAALVVCDGVTSAPLSEQASLAATDAACDVLAAAFGADAQTRTGDYWSTALKTACTAAQAQTVAVARTLGDPPEPPSCTFVASVVDAGVVYTGWCGDSRAYWLPDVGDGSVLSVDDSIASQLIAAGTPRAAAESDPRAHTITRWLGADAPDPSAKTGSLAVAEPGWVAVVSDGMWNYASEPAALRAQMVSGDAITNAKALVAFANASGGADNVTVALFRIGAVPPAIPQVPVTPEPVTPDPITPVNP
jgi:serine/threonine protein phosphatase PrpC